MPRSVLAVPILLALSACGGLELLVVTCEDAEKVWVFVDEDGDGSGSSSVGRACEAEAGQALVAGDCDDGDAGANPDAAETCDRVDNDCDGETDEGLPVSRYHRDTDGDGFGDAAGEAVESCAPRTGLVADRTDCDDTLASTFPGAPELCDGLDDDCDGFVDDADPDIDPSVLTSWYADADGDGWGNDALHQEICAQPPGSVATGGDCNDALAPIHPTAPEVCNGIDDDCNALVDAADPNIDPLLLVDTWVDADSDGYGDAATAARECAPGPGRVTNGLDCNDADPATTLAVDWVLDADLDGIGAGAVVATACSSPGAGYARASAGADCDDANPTRFPGAPELCEDGIDQDCNGLDPTCETWLYSVRTTDGMLVRLNAETLVMQDVGPLGTWFDFGDLAYDRTSHTLYMIDGRGLLGLHTVDLVTGAATLVGIHGVGDLFGLVWDASTDTLYASAAGFGAGLYTLDQATGAATYVGNPGVGLDALTHDVLRNQIVGLTAGPGDLRVVDRATGGQSFLANWGFVNNCGMAWDEGPDLYWVIDWSGFVYTFDPTNGYTPTVMLAGLAPHDGLAYVPDPPN